MARRRSRAAARAAKKHNTAAQTATQQATKQNQKTYPDDGRQTNQKPHRSKATQQNEPCQQWSIKAVNHDQAIHSGATTPYPNTPKAVEAHTAVLENQKEQIQGSHEQQSWDQLNFTDKLCPLSPGFSYATGAPVPHRQQLTQTLLDPYTNTWMNMVMEEVNCFKVQVVQQHQQGSQEGEGQAPAQVVAEDLVLPDGTPLQEYHLAQILDAQCQQRWTSPQLDAQMEHMHRMEMVSLGVEYDEATGFPLATSLTKHNTNQDTQYCGQPEVFKMPVYHMVGVDPRTGNCVYRMAWEKTMLKYQVLKYSRTTGCWVPNGKHIIHPSGRRQVGNPWCNRYGSPVMMDVPEELLMP